MGAHRWYAEGAKFLVEKQSRTGSGSTAEIGTSRSGTPASPSCS
jgi:hypothetical protein